MEHFNNFRRIISANCTVGEQEQCIEFAAWARKTWFRAGLMLGLAAGVTLTAILQAVLTAFAD